jgi:hypothetical protein
MPHAHSIRANSIAISTDNERLYRQMHSHVKNVICFYKLVVEGWIYRDFGISRDLLKVMMESRLLVGAILIILGIALKFSGYLSSIPKFKIENQPIFF